MIDALLFGWRKTGDYSLRLLEAVPEDRLTYQPAGDVSHPAWIFCHLGLYHPAILSLARGDAVADPGKHPDAAKYDEGTTPVSDASRYPANRELLQRYRTAHEKIEQALQRSGDSVLLKPAGLPRWEKAFGTTSNALTYLMLYHESVHLGQISMWRRVQGLANV